MKWKKEIDTFWNFVARKRKKATQAVEKICHVLSPRNYKSSTVTGLWFYLRNGESWHVFNKLHLKTCFTVALKYEIIILSTRPEYFSIHQTYWNLETKLSGKLLAPLFSLLFLQLRVRKIRCWRDSRLSEIHLLSSRGSRMTYLHDTVARDDFQGFPCPPTARQARSKRNIRDA